jgi:hypothetical protein
MNFGKRHKKPEDDLEWPAAGKPLLMLEAPLFKPSYLGPQRT